MEVQELAQNTTFLVCVGWTFREIVLILKNRHKNLDSAIAEHVKEMSKLTVAIVRLETKIENLESLVMIIPKMKSDLDVLHSRVRAVQPNRQ